MLDLEPRKAPSAPSALYPVSFWGLTLLFSFVASLGLVRFTIYVWSSDMAGLASAMCVIFPVLACAYVCRYLLVATEATAEGYDVMPPPPRPGEVEHVFGSLMKFLVAGLFAFLPLLAAAAFGIATGPLPTILVVLGSIYLPMAILGMAVTGDIGGAFPGTVFPAIFTVPARYLCNSLLGVAAGMLFLLGWSDLLPKLPTLAKVALDAGAGFLLIVLLHRLGVLHREEFVLRSVIPFPKQDFSAEEILTPRRPVSDIERILEERRNRERRPTPLP